MTDLLIIFGIIVVGFLAIDLGYFNRQAHKVSQKSALIQSLFWILISVFYAGAIWYHVDHELAAQFMSAYVAEKMLSVDNLFVIMLIFRFFNVDEIYHHKVLFWGILGAIVFRGLFLTVGTFLVTEFHWILYIFGGFLIWTGFKLLKAGDDEEETDFNENKVLRFAKKYLPFTLADHKGKFWMREKGKFVFTMLFMVLILIETTDIIFAFDSIPAVLSISQNPFIVFTSNIFAIMGLRALFFLVEGFLNKFEYLGKGISVILMFIGAKMLADIWHFHVSSLVSLGVIIGILTISVVASLMFPSKKEKK